MQCIIYVHITLYTCSQRSSIIFIIFMISLSPDLKQLYFILAEKLYISLVHGVLLGWCVYVCCITIYSIIVYKQIPFGKTFLSVCSFSFSFCPIFLTSCATTCFKWWWWWWLGGWGVLNWNDLNWLRPVLLEICYFMNIKASSNL